MNSEIPARVDRRGALVAGAAVVGAIATTLLRAEDASAHVGAPAVHGDSSTSEPAVSGNNTAAGAGVLGTSHDGVGVQGIHESATQTGPGVTGISDRGAGVQGIAIGGHPAVIGLAASGPGVRGESTNGPGLQAISENGNGLIATHGSPTTPGAAIVGENLGRGPGIFGKTSSANSGVRGEAPIGIGVFGVHTSAEQAAPAVLGWNSGSGPAVRGMAPGANPGVQAISGTFATPSGGPIVVDCGLALEAIGHTRLRPPNASDGTVPPACGLPTLHVEGAVSLPGPIQMYVGSGAVPAGSRDQLVSEPRANPGSHVAVTFVGPGSPPRTIGGLITPAVSWVERLPGAFRIHLTRPVAQATPFTYTVVNPAAV